MASQLLSSNPQIKQLVDEAGGDPRTAFYNLANANGIDPDEVFKMIKRLS